MIAEHQPAPHEIGVMGEGLENIGHGTRANLHFPQGVFDRLVPLGFFERVHTGFAEFHPVSLCKLSLNN